MSTTINIRQFENSEDLVDCANDILLGKDYLSIAFIGYGDIISDILGILLSEYDAEIEHIQMDECMYNDIYRLVIDENYMISLVPIKKDDGNYVMSDVDMQLISDEVSTKYVFATEKRGYRHQVFTLYADYEDDDVFEISNTKDMKSFLLNRISSDDLSVSEKHHLKSLYNALT